MDSRKLRPSNNILLYLLKPALELCQMQLLQLRDLARDLHGVPAMCLARSATAAGIEATTWLRFGQELSGHTCIAILHRVHVGSHERWDIDPLGTIFAALTALLAKFSLRYECFVCQESLLWVGVGEIADH